MWYQQYSDWLLAQHEVCAYGWQAIGTGVTSAIGTAVTAWKTWLTVDRFVRRRLAVWRDAAAARELAIETRQLDALEKRLEGRLRSAKWAPEKEQP